MCMAQIKDSVVNICCEMNVPDQFLAEPAFWRFRDSSSRREQFNPHPGRNGDNILPFGEILCKLVSLRDENEQEEYEGGDAA